MSQLTEQFFAETGDKAMYRKGSSDYHTLMYVKWLEIKAKNLTAFTNTDIQKCDRCIYWDIEHGHHEIDCYSCKRYHIDMFTLRPGVA